MKPCCGFFWFSCCQAVVSTPIIGITRRNFAIIRYNATKCSIKKCVSCGGCPTRCHRAGATTPCKCLPKQQQTPQLDSWIDVFYLAMVLLFCRHFRIASMSWIDFVTSSPALPAALVPRILSRCVICNMIVGSRKQPQSFSRQHSKRADIHGIQNEWGLGLQECFILVGLWWSISWALNSLTLISRPRFELDMEGP